MRILFKIFGLLCITPMIHADIIYGVAQVQNKYQQVHYPVYVQMGSFSTIVSAERFKHQVHVTTKSPVEIQTSNRQYKVITGPFHDQFSLKAFARKMGNIERHPLHKQQQKSSLLHNMQTQLSEVNYAMLPITHPEFSVFLGGSYIPNTISGQTLQLLPYEIGQYADTFTNQSSASAFSWGLDARYRFRLNDPSVQKYFLNSLGAGINFYQITNFNQTGKVLQFNLPEFKNYIYTLSLNDIRIMADLDLDFHPIRQYFTPFVEGGIGGARSEVSYNSAPISPVDSQNFTLPSKASWNFAYQVGAGVKYVVKTHFAISLRYLYANMGKIDSSTLGSTTTLASPLKINMSTQNFLCGLTYLVE